MKKTTRKFLVFMPAQQMFLETLGERTTQWSSEPEKALAYGSFAAAQAVAHEVNTRGALSGSGAYATVFGLR